MESNHLYLLSGHIVIFLTKSLLYSSPNSYLLTTGAFLKAKMDDFVVVKLQGPAVEALLKINKNKYKDYIIETKKEKVLYVKLLKAMYGTLKAPLLWYTLFTNILEEVGFTINPYHNCVANKVINGKKFTICWYVDDI